MLKESESNQANQLPPLTNAEIEQYLSSGLFRGIGEKTASKLVAQFGTATLSVLENSPEQLYQIPGLDRHRIGDITEAWSKSKENPAYPAVALLLGHGTSLGLTMKICEHYQQDTMNVLESDPYRLIDEVDGVGFKTADAIARSLGIEPDSESRYLQGLVQVFKDAQSQGHCFLPETELINRAIKLLELPQHTPSISAVQEAIGKGKQNQTLAAGLLSGSIYLRGVYRIELRVALQAIWFLGQPTQPTEDLEECLLRYESAVGRAVQSERGTTSSLIYGRKTCLQHPDWGTGTRQNLYTEDFSAVVRIQGLESSSRRPHRQGRQPHEKRHGYRSIHHSSLTTVAGSRASFSL